MTNVTIQVPAYEEGPSLTRTLNAITQQDVPEDVDAHVEAWVTLSPPDRELCDTWQAAMAARGVDVHEAPSGKLSARNAAHDHAVDDGADIIVQWDADAEPHHPRVLYSLLDAFDDDTVAVNGNPTASGDVLAPAVNVFGGIEDKVKPHVHGQLSAFSAHAWEQAGPFDETVEQTEIDQVRAVEEFGFYDDLSQIGKVRASRDARVENDTRRWWCRVAEKTPIGSADSYCHRRGAETFNPRRRD